MLENSILITGKEGKELEKAFAEYDDITLKIKDLTKTLDQVKAQIKEACNHAGTFETINWTIDMVERKGSVTIDTKVLKEKYPEIFEETKKVGKPSLVIGTPKRKGARN